MEDSRKRRRGHPLVGRLGTFQLIQCWEFTIPSMHAGERLEVTCPAFYAHGGAETYSDFGSMKIPANSDLTYSLEVLSCEAGIDALNKANLADRNGAPELARMGSDDDDA